ncbi:MAG: MoaD/ThiS family protein [Phycisphaeraceae bacterium]|nr:MoaD/ThiS family protein [Phycisphaeraceae bacterium]
MHDDMPQSDHVRAGGCTSVAPVTIHLRPFAVLRDLAGRDRITVTVDVAPGPATPARALARAIDMLPALAPWREVTAFARDDRFITASAALPDGATVDLLPPVSGG